MTGQFIPIFFELLTSYPYYAVLSIDHWQALTGCNSYPHINQEAYIARYGKRLRIFDADLEAGEVYVEEMLDGAL